MSEIILRVFVVTIFFVAVVAAGFFITAGVVGFLGYITGLYTFSWTFAVQVWLVLYGIKLLRWLL